MYTFSYGVVKKKFVNICMLPIFPKRQTYLLRYDTSCWISVIVFWPININPSLQTIGVHWTLLGAKIN